MQINQQAIKFCGTLCGEGGRELALGEVLAFEDPRDLRLDRGRDLDRLARALLDQPITPGLRHEFEPGAADAVRLVRPLDQTRYVVGVPRPPVGDTEPCHVVDSLRL